MSKRNSPLDLPSRAARCAAICIALCTPLNPLLADTAKPSSDDKLSSQNSERKLENKPENKAEQPSAKPAPKKVVPEGTMTIARMDVIIKRLDKDVKIPRPGTWQLTIQNRTVIIITDTKNDRMRIMSPLANSEGVPDAVMKRLMQANFDTALDARYAVARGVIWATFIHPLAALHDRQFISAIGQTVNLVLTFGTTFSSGAMSFGGGDSGDIIRKKLIEELTKKGLPI